MQPTEDKEYDERKAHLLKIKNQVNLMKKHMTAYVNAARMMCAASSELAGVCEDIYTDTDPANRPVVKSYAGALSELDARVRASSDAEFLSDVRAAI